MSEAMKGKKLPDLWIKYPSCEVMFHPEKGAHRYTPAKPAKVCVWTRKSSGLYWTSCETRGVYRYAANGPHCTFCGGKIKVKR